MSLNATKKKKLCLKCQACCKAIAIPTLRPSERDMIFYKARGCKLSQFKGALCIVIPSICPQLSKDGCKIQDKKPMDCQDFDGRKHPVTAGICLYNRANHGGGVQNGVN